MGADIIAVSGLHVEARGEGPGCVLAHGFGGSARNWRPQLRALESRFRVVAYDARGHARSDAPEDAMAYTLDALSIDLRSAAAAGGACGPDDRPLALVCGLSLGAAVALHAALRDPPGALVLSAFPAGPDGSRGPSANAAAFAEAIDRDGLEAAGARFAWGPDSGLDERGRALVRQGFLEHAPHAMAHILRETLAVLPGPERLPLASLRIPVLVIVGANDRASLRPSQVLAERIPGARLEIVPDAGHVVNLAAPGAYNDAIHTFLSDHPPPDVMEASP